jgi:hypothetical protein
MELVIRDFPISGGSLVWSSAAWASTCDSTFRVSRAETATSHVPNRTTMEDATEEWAWRFLPIKWRPLVLCMRLRSGRLANACQNIVRKGHMRSVGFKDMRHANGREVSPLELLTSRERPARNRPLSKGRWRSHHSRATSRWPIISSATVGFPNLMGACPRH